MNDIAITIIGVISIFTAGLLFGAVLIAASL